MKELEYKKYVLEQTVENEYKLDNYPGIHWATTKELNIISTYAKRNIENPLRGICHGVRNGWEIDEFKKRLPNVKMLGTEISHTAKKFIEKNVIQWDFHEIKPEWVQKYDFIYSNSFDHSYDPVHCLNQWLKCLSEKGMCFLQWNESHEKKTPWELQDVLGTCNEIVEILRFSHPWRKKINLEIYVLK